MKLLKVMACIIISLYLVACGSTDTVTTYCERSIECAEELSFPGQIPTLNECLDEYNRGEKTEDEASALEASLEICESKATCEEYIGCLDEIENF